MGHERTIAANTAWLLGQRVLMSVISLVVTALVARYLGTVQYGLLLLMLSYSVLFTPLASLGLRPYSVRIIAGDRERARSVLEENLALRLPLSLLAILAAVVWIRFESNLPVELLYVLCAQLLVNTISYCFIDALYGIESIKSVASVMAVSGIVVQSTCVAAIIANLGLEGVAWSYVAGSTVALAMAARACRRQVGAFRLFRVRREHLAHIAGSSTFFFQSVVATIRARIDVVLLTSMLGSHAAGLYGSSQALVQRLDLIHDGLSTALFPRVAGLHGKSDRELAHLVRGAVKVVLVISTPIAVGLWAVGDAIVRAVFGADFQEAGVILAIFGIGVPFNFVIGVLFNVLSAMRLQNTVFWVVAGGTVISVAGVTIGILTLGTAGAAIGFVVGQVAICVALAVVYLRHMGAMARARDLVRIALANAVMGAGLWMAADAPLVVKIGLSVVIYSGAVIVSGVVSLTLLKSVLSGRARPDAA